MKAADLYRLMESPALLTEDTLQQLKQIVDEFPYFQIARMLYLKNLAVLNDIRFGAELKKMAIYVPDRRKLFTLIEGERFGLQLQSAKEENPTREDAFSLTMLSCPIVRRKNRRRMRLFCSSRPFRRITSIGH